MTRTKNSAAKKAAKKIAAAAKPTPNTSAPAKPAAPSNPPCNPPSNPPGHQKKTTQKPTATTTWSIALAASDDEDDAPPPSSKPSTTATATAPSSGLTALQQSMSSKLSGSQFRYLNEELYTTSSSDSYKRFQTNPDLFEEYHRGFREQAKTWADGSAKSIQGNKGSKKGQQKTTPDPSPRVANNNPVEWIKTRIQNRYSNREEGYQTGVAIADFGCGDCLLHEALHKEVQPGVTAKQSITVHCLDLCAPPPPHPLSATIRACNIAQIPFLETHSIDVGVYSLALMGTDVFSILKEGSRVIKVGGRLYIAEVRSRFEDKSKAKDKKNLMPRFLTLLSWLGFECVEKDCKPSNRFFVLMEFKKIAKYKGSLVKESMIEGEGGFLLPCIYKRR